MRKRKPWLIVAKSERVSLDGDEAEADELFGLRLIVPDHWVVAYLLVAVDRLMWPNGNIIYKQSNIAADTLFYDIVDEDEEEGRALRKEPCGTPVFIAREKR